MFITVTSKDSDTPMIINSNHILAAMSLPLGEGEVVLIKMSGSEPSFKITETIDQVKELLNVTSSV